MSCLMDVSKIALDRDDRTPSVLHLVDVLAENEIRSELKEQFSVWNGAPTRGESKEVDGDPVAAIMSIERVDLVMKNGVIYDPAAIYGTIGVLSSREGR